jgi:hypothetical protein
MLPVSLNVEEAKLKETKQNMSHQSYFYTHELQHKEKIDIKQIRLIDNLTNLFTKSLPTSTFKKLVHNIRMRYLKNLS